MFIWWYRNLRLDGSGITLGVCDGGLIRSRHQEFENITNQMDTAQNLSV